MRCGKTTNPVLVEIENIREAVGLPDKNADAEFAKTRKGITVNNKRAMITGRPVSKQHKHLTAVLIT